MAKSKQLKWRFIFLKSGKKIKLSFLYVYYNWLTKCISFCISDVAMIMIFVTALSIVIGFIIHLFHMITPAILTTAYVHQVSITEC